MDRKNRDGEQYCIIGEKDRKRRDGEQDTEGWRIGQGGAEMNRRVRE